MPDVTFITSSVTGTTCFQDYNGTCIVLSTHVPLFGCGAEYARIWQAGLSGIPFNINPEPDIRLITEL